MKLREIVSTAILSRNMQPAFLSPAVSLSGPGLLRADSHLQCTASPWRPRGLLMSGKSSKPNPLNPSDPQGDSESTPDKIPRVEVFRNGTERKWAGDDMPFDVRVISPPPRHLGRFRLHPRTGRGDVIDMEGTSYVVKRVRSHFVWSAGGGSGQAGPKLTKKTVETVSVARKSIEISLERSLRES